MAYQSGFGPRDNDGDRKTRILWDDVRYQRLRMKLGSLLADYTKEDILVALDVLEERGLTCR